jgi:hypothetical protein
MLKNIIKTLSSAIRRSTMSCTKYKKSTIVDLCQHRHQKPSPTAPLWVTQRDKEIGDRGQDLHHVRKRWDRDETGVTSRGAAPVAAAGGWAGMGPATRQERAALAGVGRHQSRSRPSACALPTRIERESSASPPVAQVTLMLVPRPKSRLATHMGAEDRRQLRSAGGHRRAAEAGAQPPLHH